MVLPVHNVVLFGIMTDSTAKFSWKTSPEFTSQIHVASIGAKGIFEVDIG